jgi:hypothetical protein
MQSLRNPLGFDLAQGETWRLRRLSAIVVDARKLLVPKADLHEFRQAAL